MLAFFVSCTFVFNFKSSTVTVDKLKFSGLPKFLVWCCRPDSRSAIFGTDVTGRVRPRKWPSKNWFGNARLLNSYSRRAFLLNILLIFYRNTICTTRLGPFLKSTKKIRFVSMLLQMMLKSTLFLAWIHSERNRLRRH